MDIDLSRTRVDYREEPGGVLRVILTVTLPEGVTRRYEATLDDAELELELEPELAGESVAGVSTWQSGRAFPPAGELASAMRDGPTGPGSDWDRYWHPWRYSPAELQRPNPYATAENRRRRVEAYERGYRDGAPRDPQGRPLTRTAGLAEVGRTSSDHLGPTAAAHRRRLSWRALLNAPSERPSDWTLEAPAETHAHWWNALGHDGRKKFKIRYAAIMDHAPAGLDDDALNRWWLALSRKKRDTYRDKAETTFLERLGKVAKEVAASKVFQVAAIGLVTAVPGLGAVAGPALAAAATLQSGAKLLKASGLAKRGDSDRARTLTSEAVASAQKASKTPQEAKAILEVANAKRKNIEALAALGRPSRTRPSSSSTLARRPAPAPKPAPKPASSRGASDVLEAARLGKLRSNRGGAITPDDLLQAHAAGRVFWVAA